MDKMEKVVTLLNTSYTHEKGIWKSNFFDYSVFIVKFPIMKNKRAPVDIRISPSCLIDSSD